MKIRFFYNKYKLKVITGVYLILLIYIIAALIWWFVALLQQNNEMYEFKRNLISQDDPNFTQKNAFIVSEKQRNVAQYLGEGITFLALIVVGAIFVYRAVRKQIRLNEQQQNFMMAVTHELKTPIAITRLNLETLEKRKLDPEIQTKLIHAAIEETGRLNDLCENILLTSRMDMGRYLINKELINFSDLINRSVNYMLTRFPKRVLHVSIAENIEMDADPFLMELLIHNLIENALKYSPSDKAVDISLAIENQTILLQIRDWGKGIAENEKRKIFEKFYRTGDENTRQSKGTGLGLYLSKKIVEDHFGFIQVVPNQPNGSIFEVRFPLQKMDI